MNVILKPASLIHFCARGLCVLILVPAISWAQDTDAGLSPSLLLQKADSLQHYARYDSSNSYYLKAADLFEKKAPEKQREALYQISINKFDQDDIEASDAYLEKARSISINERKDELFNLPYYHQKGKLAEAEADYGSAMKWYQKGISLADKLNANKFAVRFKVGIAEIHASRGNYGQSVEQYSNAQSAYHRNNLQDDKLLSRLLNGLGIAHQNDGAYDKALEYYRRSLDIDKQRLPHPHPDLSKSYNNLAIVFYYQSDYQRALDYMQNSVNELSEFYGENHRLVAIGYNNIGVVYSEFGDLERAAEYLRKTIRIRKNILGESHPDVAIGYQNLGAIYLDMGDYNRAISQHRRAESLLLKNFEEGHPELASVYANLGKAFSKKGAFDKAVDYYLKDLEINRRMLSEDHPFIGDTNYKIGQLYADRGNLDQAIRYYNRALEVLVIDYSRENPDQKFTLANSVYPDLLLPVLRSKAEALFQLGDQQNKIQQTEDALQVYLKTVQFIDELQRSLIREESKLLLREKTVEVYQKGFKAAFELYEKTDNADYKEYLFYFAQKSRNQILLEQIGKLRNRSFADIPESVVAREQDLRAQITELQQRLNGFASQNEPDDSLKRVQVQDSLFHVREQLQNYMQQLQDKYPKYYGLTFEPAVASISEVQQDILSPSQTMVSYFNNGDSFFAFIISQNSFTLAELGDNSNLQQRIVDFRKTLSTSEVSKFSHESNRLYRKLLEPVTAFITGDEILIIPIGSLHYLPFESLVTSKITNSNDSSFRDLPYLLNDYAISYAPSAGYLKLRNEMQTSNDQKKMIAFAPSFNNELKGSERNLYQDYNRPVSSLLFNEREVKKLGDLFNSPEGFWSFLKSSKDQADIYTGTEATESALKKHSLDNYQFVHLATHAYVNEEQPNQSGILFSIPDKTADGTLHASEVYNLSLDAELVTLSACETGTGKLAEGEGMIGLSRAFQYAGARNMLVSLWPVNDRSSEQLMVPFYRMLKEGHSMTTALQKVKRAMIDNGQYAHPRYWAPFIYMGQ